MSSNSSFIPADLLYSAIVDSSDDAIVSKDLEGIVMSWNKAAEHIFGYEAREMIGQSIVKLMPPDLVDEETKILDRLRRGERVDHFETRRQRKDGVLIDVSLTISPIRDASGSIVGASKIARDITARQAAQRKLAEANEALVRADRIKAEFLATLSHELRTPLNAILGWVQILREGAGAEELAQSIPIIERNVRTQSQLIEDLLDMSRIETGRMSIDIQQVDLPAVVDAAIDTVRSAAVAKKIRIAKAYSSLSGIVMGDKDRLQQILWNLLTNAIKFTPQERPYSRRHQTGEFTRGDLRYRHRAGNRAGISGTCVRAVSSGRCDDNASLRRTWTGIVDRQTSHRAAGRKCAGGERRDWSWCNFHGQLAVASGAVRSRSC